MTPTTPPPAETVYAVLRNGTESQRKCADPVKFLSMNIHPSLWDLYTFRDPSGKVWRVEAGLEVKEGDIIQEGDEWRGGDGNWRPATDTSIGCSLRGASFRRPPRLVPAEPIQPKPEAGTQQALKEGIETLTDQKLWKLYPAETVAVAETPTPLKGTIDRLFRYLDHVRPDAPRNSVDPYSHEGGYSFQDLRDIRDYTQSLERQATQLSTDLAHAQANAERLEKERDEIRDHMNCARIEAGVPNDEVLVIHCRELRARAEQATGLLSLWLNPPDNTLPFGKTRAFLATPDSQATLTPTERIEEVTAFCEEMTAMFGKPILRLGDAACLLGMFYAERDALQAKVRELEEVNCGLWKAIALACNVDIGYFNNASEFIHWNQKELKRLSEITKTVPADSILVSRARLEEMDRLAMLVTSNAETLRCNTSDLIAPTGDRKV